MTDYTMRILGMDAEFKFTGGSASLFSRPVPDTDVPAALGSPPRAAMKSAQHEFPGTNRYPES